MWLKILWTPDGIKLFFELSRNILPTPDKSDISPLGIDPSTPVLKKQKLSHTPRVESPGTEKWHHCHRYSRSFLTAQYFFSNRSHEDWGLVCLERRTYLGSLLSKLEEIKFKTYNFLIWLRRNDAIERLSLTSSPSYVNTLKFQRRES